MKKPSNPIALRLSGHLLVGLSRIYAKKVQYLLTDSSDTLHNLTVSHRAKAVDVDFEAAEEDTSALNRTTTGRGAAQCVFAGARPAPARSSLPPSPLTPPLAPRAPPPPSPPSPAAWPAPLP